MRFVSLILIFAPIIILGVMFLAKSDNLLSYLSHKNQIKWQWYTTHYSNQIQKRNPKALQKIQSSKIIYLSENTKSLIKNVPHFLEGKKTGKYRLEIQLLDWTHKKEKGLIIEYHLYDLKTDNKVWEYGQTFPLI